MADLRPVFLPPDVLTRILSQISAPVDVDAIWTDLHLAIFRWRVESAPRRHSLSIGKQKEELARQVRMLDREIERLEQIGSDAWRLPWIEALQDGMVGLRDTAAAMLDGMPATRRGQGRPREDHVADLIHALADVYEKHTRRPAKAVADPMRPGPNPSQYQFQQFATEALIAAGLPDRPGLEHRVYRELRNRMGTYSPEAVK